MELSPLKLQTKLPTCLHFPLSLACGTLFHSSILPGNCFHLRCRQNCLSAGTFHSRLQVFEPVLIHDSIWKPFPCELLMLHIPTLSRYCLETVPSCHDRTFCPQRHFPLPIARWNPVPHCRNTSPSYWKPIPSQPI